MYPARLSDLGPERCLDLGVASGDYAGYAFTYTLDNDHGFVLTAIHRQRFERENRKYAGDASGRVYLVQDVDGSASVTNAGVAQAALVALADCLVKNAESRSGGGFPATLNEARATCPFSAIGSYKIDYVQTQGGSGFSLDSRPETYGSACVRSYHTDESRVVRATGQDRPATIADEQAAECELQRDAVCQDGSWVRERLVTVRSQP